MDLLSEALKLLGGGAALVLAAAWLARLLLQSRIDQGLKAQELALKLRLDTEMAAINDRLQREREAQARHADASLARAERLRAEVARWANPIRGAVLDLKARLNNMLNDDAYLALQRQPVKPIDPRWSIDPGYFVPSTLYLFCQYFHWVRRLQMELGFELFEQHTEKDDFMAKLLAVSQALSDWPVTPRCEGSDRQVFSLQQRALGEAMTVRAEAGRCLGYDEFLMQMEDAPLADLLLPLQALLQDLDPRPDDCRWPRLERVLAALQALDDHTRSVLQRPVP
jgi:hypothetical protein